MTDYSTVAQTYCHDIIANKIPACQYVHQAVRRHLNDLSRQSTPDFQYRFDTAKADRVCAFIEHLPHVKGHLAGQLIHLDPYQVWILSSVFGWVNNGGKKDGMRRYRRAFLELPRSSGKSSLSSGVALYMLSADGSQCDAYALASSRDQARIVFSDAQSMARSPAAKNMMNHLGVSVNAHSVTVARTNSRFMAMSAEANSLEGLNIQCGIVDELHSHPTRSVFEATCLGAVKRPESLVWIISTAGFDLAGIGYETHVYLTKVLSGVVRDDEFFGAVWSIDPFDDWQNPACWKKAHPGLGITIDEEYFGAMAREAIAVPSKQPGFQTKYLNLWLSNSHSWADLPSWQRCMDTDLKIEDFHGRPVFLGLDLASKTDMAAKIILAPMENGHFAVFPTYYLPEAAINSGQNSQYKGWFIEGRIRTTDGNVLDFDVIENDIMADMELFDVQEVAIDPYEARQLIQRLMARSVPVVTVPQTVMHLSEPTKELDALTRSEKLHYNCPVLLWMASNVVVRLDLNDNVKPNKTRPEDKIDGVIATILALARAMLHQPADLGVLIDFI